jgi:hypothetical protein
MEADFGSAHVRSEVAAERRANRRHVRKSRAAAEGGKEFFRGHALEA